MKKGLYVPGKKYTIKNFPKAVPSADKRLEYVYSYSNENDTLAPSQLKVIGDPVAIFTIEASTDPNILYIYSKESSVDFDRGHLYQAILDSHDDLGSKWNHQLMLYYVDQSVIKDSNFSQGPHELGRGIDFVQY